MAEYVLLGIVCRSHRRVALLQIKHRHTKVAQDTSWISIVSRRLQKDIAQRDVEMRDWLPSWYRASRTFRSRLKYQTCVNKLGQDMPDQALWYDLETFSLLRRLSSLPSVEMFLQALE
jgi:hypothetical protein